MALSKFRAKGHCGLEALQNGRVRGQGWAERMSRAEKKLVGKSRRVSRREVPKDQFDG